jgi:tetratricopeptide (TPR) repeat protein
MEAECWMRHSEVLEDLGRRREAVALVERAIPLLESAYGKDHPEVGNAYVARGRLYRHLNQHAEALADLEHGIAVLERAQGLEPGYLACAHAARGLELWATDRARARRDLDAAQAEFAKASPAWGKVRRAYEPDFASHR